MTTKINTVKKKPKQTLKQQVITEEKEKRWRIPPSDGIPKYSAETDPYCPAAQIRKYNQEKKIKAKEAEITDRNANHWMNAAMESNFKDDPLIISPSLQTKAKRVLGKYNSYENSNTYENNSKESLAEIEIIQKIIVRENLLMELKKLLRSQNDIVSALGEVIELVKAIRYQTLDVIEDINSWQKIKKPIKAFLYKGINYLIKMRNDLDFLDNYDEVVERVCFEFKSNPLAYRGGGNIITGYDYDEKQYQKNLMNSYSDSTAFVDGLEVYRLHNAEKIIQGEFIRIVKERSTAIGHGNGSTMQTYSNNHNNSYDNSHITYGNCSSEYQNGSNEISALDFMNSSIDVSSNTHLPNINESSYSPTSDNYDSNQLTNSKSTSAIEKGGKGKKGLKNVPSSGYKTSQVFNPRKIKQERIATLVEESNELQAMISHIEEQIELLVQKHKSVNTKRKQCEMKGHEAQTQGREAAAQHLYAEASVAQVKLQEYNTKIKDLQRESYFITLERKRKTGLIHKLKEELVQEKKKSAIQAKLQAKIKKEGLLAAIASFNASPEEFLGKKKKKTRTESDTAYVANSSKPSEGSEERKHNSDKTVSRSDLEGYQPSLTDYESELDADNHYTPYVRDTSYNENSDGKYYGQKGSLHSENELQFIENKEEFVEGNENAIGDEGEDEEEEEGEEDEREDEEYEEGEEDEGEEGEGEEDGEDGEREEDSEEGEDRDYEGDHHENIGHDHQYIDETGLLSGGNSSEFNEKCGNFPGFDDNEADWLINKIDFKYDNNNEEVYKDHPILEENHTGYSPNGGDEVDRNTADGNISDNKLNSARDENNRNLLYRENGLDGKTSAEYCEENDIGSLQQDNCNQKDKLFNEQSADYNREENDKEFPNPNENEKHEDQERYKHEEDIDNYMGSHDHREFEEETVLNSEYQKSSSNDDVSMDHHGLDHRQARNELYVSDEEHEGSLDLSSSFGDHSRGNISSPCRISGPTGLDLSADGSAFDELEYPLENIDSRSKDGVERRLQSSMPTIVETEGVSKTSPRGNDYPAGNAYSAVKSIKGNIMNLIEGD